MSSLPLVITWCYNHGIKKLPNYRWTRWYPFRDTIGYHSNTIWPAKNTFNFSFKRLSFKNGTVKFFLNIEFDKQDKMQLLAKCKKILYMGFRATVNFGKFKVALNPKYRVFLRWFPHNIRAIMAKIKLPKNPHSMVIFWIKVRRSYQNLSSQADPARENWTWSFIYFT